VPQRRAPIRSLVRPFLRAIMEQILNRRCHPSCEQWTAAFALSAVAAAITTPIAVSVNVWSGASTAVLCFVPMRWIAPRMPEM
jgi:hypothetical protein